MATSEFDEIDRFFEALAGRAHSHRLGCRVREAIQAETRVIEEARADSLKPLSYAESAAMEATLRRLIDDGVFVNPLPPNSPGASTPRM